MASELAKVNGQRFYNGLLWDAEWHRLHIPVGERLKKIDSKYIIEPCLHCEALNGK